MATNGSLSLMHAHLEGYDMQNFKLPISGIDYALCEAGTGPLVLLMHGMFSGKALMLPQLEHLRTRFRCVTFDWRGHAETGFDPKGWSADDLVDDVLAIIDALGERSACLAGVSQGGAIAMRVALRAPDKCRALVNLCGGPGAIPAAAAERLDAFAETLAIGDADERQTVAANFVSTMYHAPGFSERDPRSFEKEVGVILSHSRESVRLIPGVPKSYRDITADLHRISCPSLVIWAGQDGRPTLGAEIAQAIPHAELVTIANSGHHVNVDAPEAVSDALDRFLSGI